MDTISQGKYLISILRSVLSGSEMPQKPPEISWEDLFTFSLHHKVANILAYAAEGHTETIPSGVLEKMRTELHLTVAQEANQEYEAKRIFQEFEKNKIPYMPLKGYIIKTLYPAPDMRTMSDIDILIQKKDAEKSAQIMAALGYQTRFSNVEEDAYLKPPLASFELHKQMIGAEHKEFCQYYGDGWKLAKIQDGFHFYMSDEDYYIYHVVHLAKHYKERGTGIRSILDIEIYNRAKGQELDWAYIRQELNKLGLGAFERNVFQLAMMWFENGETTPIISQMERFIFESGVYGKQDNFFVLRKSEGRLKHFIRFVFPPLKVMSGLYPIVQKCPALMPVFWLHRIFNRLFRSRGRLSALTNKKETAETKKAEILKSHLKDVGL